MFKPRLTRPEKGNPFYNTKSNGGVSTAIKGAPTDKDCDVLANCVGYAAGRFNEILGSWKYLSYPPNAENFVQAAKAQGLKCGDTPKLGAILVFAKGKVGDASDGAGHVAVVEEIKADGSIVTSESGYGCSNPWWLTTRKNDGNWGGGAGYTFIGFIYQPNEDSSTKPLVKKGDIGEYVKQMQSRLAETGYLRINEVDGAFGKITLGALLAFQFENGLDVDGLCGTKTWTALDKK